jgi:virginiamycin B lyase
VGVSANPLAVVNEGYADADAGKPGILKHWEALVKKLALVALAAVLGLPALAGAQADVKYSPKEWPVEWGGRVRDPAVAPDGRVWFVGQQGNYIAVFDPKTETFRRYEIEAGTNPHNLIVDPQGIVWYAGNRNGRIGRLDPATGEIKTIMTGEAQDPHTLLFDGKGHIWFTSQGSSRVGRLTMATGDVKLINPHDQPANPYGIVLDSEGRPVVALFRTNTTIRIDPNTFEITRFPQKDAAARSRRVESTADGMIWYGDEARGFLGRINPATGEITEWQSPSGAGGRPYALTKDDQGRVWFSETGPTKQLVIFDPKLGEYVATIPVSGNVRHMFFDAKTGSMWFGTDANNLGRVERTPAP